MTNKNEEEREALTRFFATLAPEDREELVRAMRDGRIYLVANLDDLSAVLTQFDS